MEEKSKKATQEGADYEKKYKELVGKIEKAYLYAQTDSTKAVLEEIRHELQESEDERIRKAILGYLTIMWGNSQDDVCGVHVEDAIAWLEKQKYSDFDLENEYWRGYDDAKKHIEEKQLTEQKHVMWSDDDEELLQHCCGAVAAADYYTLEDKEEMENWLKSLKKRMEEL